METHQSLDEFQSRHSDLDKEAFLAKFPDPFLLVELGTKPDQPEMFQTLSGTKNPNRPTEPISKNGKFLYSIVVSLTKTDRNTFQNMITVGRASNNDVIISHPSISKFHAYFRVDPESDKATITDVGSSYGTVAEGNVLEKNTAFPVQSGSVLIFSRSAKATFLSPADFFKSLHGS